MSIDNCYGSAQVPASSEELAERFRKLRKERNQPAEQVEARRRIAKLGRDAILQKTGRRCHICGGNIDKDSYWEADHVFPAKGEGRAISIIISPRTGFATPPSGTNPVKNCSGF